ncbi:CHD5-like protein-domain-containing protein [Lipomyces oligophaga]|uniref:CHD5-like protein-domain-containing protein n=1 Tax=Lipomyces oligophaga TaxID=45792 RepID=UPI0034CFCE26
MVPLIWIVVLVVVFNLTVKAIGNDTISEVAWYLWTLLIPTAASREAKQLRVSNSELFQMVKDLAGISAQDEFSAWAKLNRKVEKKRTESERLKASLSGRRTYFKTIIKRMLWVTTMGLKFSVRIKFRKAAVFWLPPGLLPFWMEYVLALTSAPKGSVSVAAWFMIVEYALSGPLNSIFSGCESLLKQKYYSKSKLAEKIKVPASAEPEKPSTEKKSD